VLGGDLPCYAPGKPSLVWVCVEAGWIPRAGLAEPSDARASALPPCRQRSGARCAVLRRTWEHDGTLVRTRACLRAVRCERANEPAHELERLLEPSRQTDYVAVKSG